MKRVSNVKRIMNLAHKYPGGFTTKDVLDHIKGINPSSMHACLWGLKKKGMLKHDKDMGRYTLGKAALTDVNKAPAPEKRPDAPPDLQNKYVGSQGEAELLVRNADLQHKLEDALAIVRYLEDKLFKAIQFDARNGRNS